MPAFALFVALLGSGMAAATGLVTWVCSQGRGPASLEAGPAAFITLPVYPHTSAVGRRPEPLLSRPVAALLRSLIIWELVVGGPGAALSPAWLPILFPWLVLGLLWVC